MTWKFNLYALSNDLDIDISNLIDNIEMKLKLDLETHVENSDYITNIIIQTILKQFTESYSYLLLAGRVLCIKLHEETEEEFSQCIQELYRIGQISPYYYTIIMKNADILNQVIEHSRDFTLDYFTYKFIEKILKRDKQNKIIDRPQYMWMRIALNIHGKNIDKVIETYHALSQHLYFHSSNSLINALHKHPQFANNFSLDIRNSLGSLLQAIEQYTLLANCNGQITLNMNDCVKVKPAIDIFKSIDTYVNKKNDLIVSIEPWHPQIDVILDEIENNEKFYCVLWIPDLFMERVADKKLWTLQTAHGLNEKWGEEFNKSYLKYESFPLNHKTINAYDLWYKILNIAIQTGRISILFKDTCNAKNNQQGLGTLRYGTQYSSIHQINTQHYATISLHKFVSTNKSFDFFKLKQLVKLVVINLNRIIDANYYPTIETEKSSLLHRAISINVQGLAETFIQMGFPYISDKSKNLQKHIFETIYYGALEQSCELAQLYGAYTSFSNSFYKNGILNYHLYDAVPTQLWDWDLLKNKIQEYGLRNSIFISLIYDSAAAILAGVYSVSFEPISTNLFVLGINDYLLSYLKANNIEVTDELKHKIIDNRGSIQNLSLPTHIKELFKTVWEISPKDQIDMCIERAPYIDQNQAINIHLNDPNPHILNSLLFYAWQKKLKTGVHKVYTRMHNNALIKHNDNITSESNLTDDIRIINNNNDDLEEFILEPNNPIIVN